MYYPIGWPRKLSCNVNLNHSVPCTEPQQVVEEVTNQLEPLKVNGGTSKLNHPESNGHIPQIPETNSDIHRLSNGSSVDTRILQVIANGDRSLLLVLTYNSLRLWYPKVSFDNSIFILTPICSRRLK